MSEQMNVITVTEIEISPDTGIRWVELSGTDYGTNREFDADIYGITTDNKILDCDGCPLTEGDRQTIAVRNSI